MRSYREWRRKHDRTSCSDSCVYWRIFRKYAGYHKPSSGKNPKVRIVINCITLETVTEAMNAIRDFGLEDVDIVQLAAARSKSIGRYHMMMGENPIYIISCSGRGEEIR